MEYLPCHDIPEGPCGYGDPDACIDPPFPGQCAEEYECDPDIPVVFITDAVATGGQALVEWVGIDATDQIQLLVTGRFIDLFTEPVPVYGLIDMAVVPDVDAPGLGLWASSGTALIGGVTYTVFARRIRDGKASAWSTKIFYANEVDTDYIIDGDDYIIDDLFGRSVAARIVTVFIVDDS